MINLLQQNNTAMLILAASLTIVMRLIGMKPNINNLN